MKSLSQYERPASPYILNKIFSFDESGQQMESLQMNNCIRNLSGLNEKELILRIIKENNFNKNYIETNYSIKNAHMIKNILLEYNYINKRREMKVSRTNVQERFTYFIAENQAELNEIINNGFVRSNSSMNLLGASSNGIHLSKHLDIELEYQFKQKKNKSFYCLMVKTLIGKTCLVQPSESNKSINPNYLADCHLSKEITTQSQDLDTKRANSLIYVYDLNKFGILNSPIRNAVPFALIEFSQEQKRKNLPKSSSYYNLAEIANPAAKEPTNPVFEKTPAWRESYEKEGSLIDVLKKYYKNVRSSPMLEPAQIIKRSKTFYVPHLTGTKLSSKSVSCLRDCYLIERQLRKEKNETNNLKRRRSSSLAYTRSSSDASDYFHAKRRFNADGTLESLDFSTDYSFYSSFSSVFESASSITSFTEDENYEESKTDDALNEEDIVYLNDCSGEIFSSQSEDKIEQCRESTCHPSVLTDVNDNTRDENNEIQNIMRSQHIVPLVESPVIPSYLYAQQFNYSIPPPPLTAAYQPKLYYPYAFNPFLYYQNYYNYSNYPYNNANYSNKE